MHELERIVRKQKLRNILTLMYEVGEVNEVGNPIYRIDFAYAVMDDPGNWQPMGTPSSEELRAIQEAERLGEEWVDVD